MDGLYHDSPLRLEEQDEFDRLRSISELVALIEKIDTSDGVTIGVLGPWGSGKSSVLNLLAPRLVPLSAAPDVIRLNPWLFADAGTLVSQLLAEFSRQLHLDNSEVQGKVLNSIADLLFVLEPVGSSLAMPGLGTALSQAVRWLKRRFLVAKSVDQLRRDIAAEFRKLERPVFVMIDDLDRLQVEELRQTLRFIRLVGDLPRVVFLVAIDERFASEMLDGVTNDRGHQYLEKVLTSTFTLPDIGSKQIAGFVMRTLETLLNNKLDLDMDLDFGASSAIEKLILTPRDAKRLAFSVFGVIAVTGATIRTGDLIQIESLRLKEPRLFEYLEDGPLTGHAALNDVPGWGTSSAVQTSMDKWVRAAPQSEADMETVLRTLFPQAWEDLGKATYSASDKARWLGEGRLGAAANWSLYRSHLKNNEHLLLDFARLIDDSIALSPHSLVATLRDQPAPDRRDIVLTYVQNHERVSDVVYLGELISIASIWGWISHSDSSSQNLRRSGLQEVVRQMTTQIDIDHRRDWSMWIDRVVRSGMSMSSQFVIGEMLVDGRNYGEADDEPEQREIDLVESLREQLLQATDFQLASEWDLAYLLLRMQRRFPDLELGLGSRSPQVLRKVFETSPTWSSRSSPERDHLMVELFGEALGLAHAIAYPDLRRA